MDDIINNNNLIWIDLEMTGLDTVNDEIIEIATIVTDKELNIVAEGPMIAIHQPQSRLDQLTPAAEHPAPWSRNAFPPRP